MSSWEIANAITSAANALSNAITQHGRDQITAAKIQANAMTISAGNAPRYHADGTVKQNRPNKDML